MSTLVRKPRSAARFAGAARRLAVRALDVLRAASWVTGDRLRLWGGVLAVASVTLLAIHVAHHTAIGVTSIDGDPLADDFINYFAGARLAASGQAPLVYDQDRFHAFEQSITGPVVGKSRDPWIAVRIYSYPPTALLLSLPLALFSFVPALIVWVAAGVGVCFALLRRLVGWRAAALAAVGVPAAFFNLQSGQNGYFTAALLAGGLMLLDQRPVVAGICFGCLAYKPQIAVLLPFALAADARWRTIVAAAFTVAVLGLASLALFGTATWDGFIERMAVQRYLLEYDRILWDRMLSVFAAAREFGAPNVVAYAAQSVSTVLALTATIVVWRAPAPIEVKFATPAVATFLATPYALDYDAVVLIFAAAWLGREGLRTGFLPWERIAILALLIVTLPTVLATRSWGVSIGPVVLWPVLLLLVRRGIANPAEIGAIAAPGAAVAD